MVEIEDQISINAPIADVFDADRNISLHIATQTHRNEKAIGGISQRLIELGQEVEWEARHSRIRQRHRSRITEMDRPHFFRDDMIDGVFKTFSHEHYCESIAGNRILKRDILRFAAPFGILGRLAEMLFLKRYMTKFVERKNLALKSMVEQNSDRSPQSFE